MRDSIYFRWFMKDLKRDHLINDYREMSINQQKDWYINWLEKYFDSREYKLDDARKS